MRRILAVLIGVLLIVAPVAVAAPKRTVTLDQARSKSLKYAKALCWDEVKRAFNLKLLMYCSSSFISPALGGHDCYRPTPGRNDRAACNVEFSLSFVINAPTDTMYQCVGTVRVDNRNGRIAVNRGASEYSCAWRKGPTLG